MHAAIAALILAATAQAAPQHHYPPPHAPYGHHHSPAGGNAAAHTPYPYFHPHHNSTSSSPYSPATSSEVLTPPSSYVPATSSAASAPSSSASKGKACKNKNTGAAPGSSADATVSNAGAPYSAPSSSSSSQLGNAPGSGSSLAPYPYAPVGSSVPPYANTSTAASVPAYTPTPSSSTPYAYAPGGSSSVTPAAYTPTPVVPASSSLVSSSSSVSSSTAPTSTGKVTSAGINIAGCDFGCDTSGNCQSGSQCPTEVGPTQMQHFSADDGLNIFRLPVGWQYLVNNQLSGALDEKFMSDYDGLVQSCLKLNARCIIDIHNYARWNGQIVGQSEGGPTNDDLADLWTKLATKYATNSNVVFGIMNEPHDLDMTKWAATVQAVVTAIRQAGASDQWILLPGTNYTATGGYEYASAPALEKVTNPDGSTDNLVFDIHNYYDSDNSGTNAECVADHVDDRFKPLGDYLRTSKRQAFLSETGGGNTASCEQYICNALEFMSSYSDVYLGWTGWAAGSFDSSYVLSEVPDGATDKPLVQQCIAGKFKGTN
ncbi:MAG: hypothetical protein Q9162_002950 [Coniocarpon cinnabarinum]